MTLSIFVALFVANCWAASTFWPSVMVCLWSGICYVEISPGVWVGVRVACPERQAAIEQIFVGHSGQIRGCREHGSSLPLYRVFDLCGVGCCLWEWGIFWWGWWRGQGGLGRMQWDSLIHTYILVLPTLFSPDMDNVVLRVAFVLVTEI